MNIELLFLLLICHWAADYTHLSQPYMLAAKRLGKPVAPILAHAAVHGVLMMAVIGYYIDGLTLVLLFLIQVLTHFIIDTLKGKCNVWFPALANPANPYHWYVFGADQILHVSVIIIMWQIVNETL